MESLTGQPIPKFPFDVQTVASCMQMLRKGREGTIARHAKAILREEGFDTRRTFTGSYRFCYVRKDKDYVVKTGDTEYATDITRRTWENVRTYWSDALPKIAPTWWERGVEIQLFAPPDSERYFTHSKEILRAFPTHGIGDLHQFNIGWRDDQWYVIDFSSWPPVK